MKIRDAVVEMLEIVAQLQKTYPKKRFTLDGRLVGDLGEILAEEEYDITLYEKQTVLHDAETRDGRLVQIKATMQNGLTFPSDHVPNYYLGLKIHRDGRLEEIFNGPGALVWEIIKHRKPPKRHFHTVSLAILRRADGVVKSEDRIRKK